MTKLRQRKGSAGGQVMHQLAANGVERDQTTEQSATSDETNRTLVLTALLEEYKSRSQDLFNLQNENNRWATLYISALTIVAGWVVTNDKSGTIQEFFHKGDSSYFLMALALINSFFTLSMAFKGYQVQLICLYLNQSLGRKIARLINEEFEYFEVWRRWDFQQTARRGKHERIRVFYYACISILPVAVSATILYLYGRYEWKQHGLAEFTNVFFYFTCLFVLASLIASVSTTSLNKRWEEHCRTRAPKESQTP